MEAPFVDWGPAGLRGHVIGLNATSLATTAEDSGALRDRANVVGPQSFDHDRRAETTHFIGHGGFVHQTQLNAILRAVTGAAVAGFNLAGLKEPDTEA